MVEFSLQAFIGGLVTFFLGVFGIAVKLVYDNISNRLKELHTALETQRVESNAADAVLGAQVGTLEKRLAEVAHDNLMLHREDSIRQEKLIADVASTMAAIIALTRAIERMHNTIGRHDNGHRRDSE